jgi:hypothetical protein
MVFFHFILSFKRSAEKRRNLQTAEEAAKEPETRTIVTPTFLSASTGNADILVGVC